MSIVERKNLGVSFQCIIFSASPVAPWLNLGHRVSTESHKQPYKELWLDLVQAP